MKKLLISMLVAAMLASLASCSGDKSEQSADPSSASPTETEAAADPVTDDSIESDSVSSEEVTEDSEIINEDSEPTDTTSGGSGIYNIPDIGVIDTKLTINPPVTADLSLSQSFDIGDIQFYDVQEFVPYDFEIDDLTDIELETLIAHKNEVVAELENKLSAKGISVNINEDTGEITLDSGILFDFNSYEISTEGKAYLDKFIEAYSSVVFSDMFEDTIDELIIEGHTDSNGDDVTNSTLSKKRADAVRSYCIAAASSSELDDMLISEGLGSTKPVLNDDGSINDAASRRVTFRFIIDVDSIID